MVAAGPRVVGAQGGIGAVGAGLVLVVGLVVPGPVVEILVLVGGLGAVEPVDGHALVGRGVGGGGVVAGVGVFGAADHPEARAVGPDVGVAGRGEVLDEGVVVRDIGGRGVALGGGEEQQPELVAGAQAGGDEAPVRGDLGGGGRGQGCPQHGDEEERRAACAAGDRAGCSGGAQPRHGTPRLPAPGASFSTPGERQLRRAARRRGRLGFQLGKRIENRKVGWARNGRKTDHGVVPPQDAGASTCDTQGPGHGGGHHRNSNDKARSHSRKIVLSIGVENRARTGGQRTSIAHGNKGSHAAGNKLYQMTGLSSTHPTKRLPTQGPARRLANVWVWTENQKIIGTNAARATARRFHLSIGVQYRPCRCSAPLRVDRSGRRCFHADTSIDPPTRTSSIAPTTPDWPSPVGRAARNAAPPRACAPPSRRASRPAREEYGGAAAAGIASCSTPCIAPPRGCAGISPPDRRRSAPAPARLPPVLDLLPP